MTETLREKVERLKRERGVEPEAPAPGFDDDLIPDLGPATSRERTAEDDDVDALIGGLNVIEAYRRYIGKMDPQVGKRRESIMISCPVPGHTDSHPSAWANLDKNTWFCAVCDQGGDVYDLAAIGKGYGVPGYKADGSFPKLRKEIAEDLGYVVRRTPGGVEYVDAVEVEEEMPATEADDDKPVIDLEPEFVPELPMGSRIDWRSIFPENTFLRQWMETTSVDDLPDEFYFWLGLTIVGAAAGDDVVLEDFPAVKGNLFICLLGPTGIGKTRSISTAILLLREALPYDPDDPASTGTCIIPTPGSAESLIDAFSKPIPDPADPTKIIGYGAVRGLLRFDEFASLAGRSSRHGSVMKPTLMELFDSYQPVDLKTRTHGYTRAENHYCMCVTTTQPRSVRAVLGDGDADSGFVNRWVFVLGVNKELHSLSKGKITVDHLVKPLRDLRAWSRMTRSQRVLPMEPDAFAAWDSFFKARIAPLRVDYGSPVLSRIDLQMKKLMVLFAINEKKSSVDLSIIRRVIAMFEYLRFTYFLVSGHLNGSPIGDCVEAIRLFVVDFDERHGKGPTARDITRSLSKRFTPDVLARTIKAMVDMGELEEHTVRPDGRGRPTTRYSYVA